MKYKLLSVRGKEATNIGDYVQALASSQLLPTVDGFVNREELAQYDGDDCGIIMNGWFMHDPSSWPPSAKLHPLFVAFHINSSVAEIMLSKEGIRYLKQYEPIGCRDTNSVDLLKRHGIDAYFSGCMTLTLGKNYYNEETDNSVFFVDPIIPKSTNVFDVIKNVLFLFSHIKDVKVIANKLYNGYTISFKRLLLTAGFFRLYARWFDKSIITDAEYISQENSFYKEQFKTDEERLSEAERLVRLYSKAGLVVTKRIHCALPCLGIETPVVFLTDTKDKEISTCRFGGLIELFNTIECTDKQLLPKFDLEKRIGWDNIPKNKTLWKKYAQQLISTCDNYIKNNK